MKPPFGTPSENALVFRVGVILAIPLALVVLIPVLIGIYLVDREADVRARENRTLISQFQQADQQHQDVLVLLVCTTIAEANNEALVVRFQEILRDAGQSCNS